ncbi:MAG: hypothetical protein DWB56_14685 [Candidatus Jettenia sp.]|uniref:Putative methyltransferase n=1 Tax=Candidatus Jettenia caeni TaxID=247490 RepID=I3IPG4_9BACT|nr:methyltransferase domain-containing protein [Candidatus Jettenia sp. AMX1]MBC6930178.1 hypothetical protein [Candidatus Jettenia sp.]NUN22464.1 hypothetical protein [Candidatus Jettenia caeni]KAA0248624.1 MAG: hypothetical protein EDM77_12050 [Candidatus Jettenia sp. AMX1]MCE7881584.1 hypothetical protein [Candidatus Jettenia sp. AMX1]MCQ3927700.1 hypothetical protein [Candidatus Jettenia sp.]
MKLVTFQEFNEIYQESVRTVFTYWTPQMQMEIATHCYSWSPNVFDFQGYLQASAIRFYKAYSTFAENGCEQTICDIGGFWSVFPITLRKLGFAVTMTESLQYYSNSFNNLFKHAADWGVTVVSYDPFQAGAIVPGCFDVITIMAVLEHYPHSLKTFMDNITSMLNSKGILYIEVPNIAYWPKRISLLFGRTPLVQLQEIYKSKVPFIGHHHEFTIGELRDLAKLSKLAIAQELYFNYSAQNNFFRRFIAQPLETLIQFAIPDTREVLAIVCQQYTKS